VCTPLRRRSFFLRPIPQSRRTQRPIDEARGPNRSPTMIIAGYALLALGYTLLAIATLTGIGH
jgi:hypothetical protein